VEESKTLDNENGDQKKERAIAATNRLARQKSPSTASALLKPVEKRTESPEKKALALQTSDRLYNQAKSKQNMVKPTTVKVELGKSPPPGNRLGRSPAPKKPVYINPVAHKVSTKKAAATITPAPSAKKAFLTRKP